MRYVYVITGPDGIVDLSGVVYSSKLKAWYALYILTNNQAKGFEITRMEVK